MNLQARIESAITDASGERAKLTSSDAVYGGCINDSRVVTLTDGRRYFVKTHARARQMPNLFTAEYIALKLIYDTNTIRVPQPIASGDDFLVLEYFQAAPPADNWHQTIGRQLASLHQSTQLDQFGFQCDNYIGLTPQPNDWTDDWLSFWRDHRLGWQLELYSRRCKTDDPLLQLGEQLLNRLPELIGPITEPAVLLHGDLWSGNAGSDEQGQPIIFDPASYYGHREVEIGMMRMFGGFGTACEQAYNEVWPFQPGAEQRICLYRLYHELNHLNLFGQAYYSSCIDSARTLLN